MAFSHSRRRSVLWRTILLTNRKSRFSHVTMQASQGNTYSVRCPRDVVSSLRLFGNSSAIKKQIWPGCMPTYGRRAKNGTFFPAWFADTLALFYFVELDRTLSSTCLSQPYELSRGAPVVCVRVCVFTLFCILLIS